MVLEPPPKALGTLDDDWRRYLILPPEVRVLPAV
jgi:hypothetical protein